MRAETEPVGPAAAGPAAGPGGALRGVLFDMDGLLIDSERLWLAAEHEVMRWLGGPWGPEHQRRLVGGSLDRAVTYMLSLTGPVATPAEVAGRLLAAMAGRLAEGVQMLPGAADLLAEVAAAGVPCALVSSTHRSLMEHALDGIGREYFHVTVAGDEVASTKPDPEPYLRAARLLGVPPGGCVALEDSPAGVTAAEAAGCVTVAVPGVLEVPDAPGRTVVGSLTEMSLGRLIGLVAG